MIALYTDGLVESTGAIIAGTARLRRMLARPDVRDAPHPAATLCRLTLRPTATAAVPAVCRTTTRRSDRRRGDRDERDHALAVSL
jgi:hypothetical protein